MKLKYLLATTALVLPAVAHAQSTGSVDFEETVIVVTGSTTRDVEGVIVPDTSKAKQVLTQEQLEHNSPGQTVLDSINIIPGVTFTNNDAYGGAGGQLSIRGFTADRISLTFDGIPLNDSGNYAIYASQQLDPELIEQVNVNLGSTDVDSPTAAATGSTVNYRTREPGDDFGGQVVASLGEFNYYRVFGMIDTGEFTSFGTKAFFAASHQQYDNPYNNYGKIQKDQFNARIYQPLGGDGDFVSVSGHFNMSRNNFFGSLPLRLDPQIGGTGATASLARIVGGQSDNRFPRDNEEREYDINFPCTVDTAQAGVADVPDPRPALPTASGGCGTEFDRRYNPSDTGNVRGASRFSLAEGITLTVDPSFQYVKANGGGTVTAQEFAGRDINPADPDGPGGEAATATPAQCRANPTAPGRTCVAGYLGGVPYFGRDLNGDADLLDTVTVVAPSQTQTNRLGVISNLIWEVSPEHTVRFAYTFDRARHRQTGEVGLVDTFGEPFNVFPVDDPQADSFGVIMQKRDRRSLAILHQVSGEYRGEFLDGSLVATIGVRAPFFKRDLNNFCFTTSETGFVECFGDPADPRNAQFATLNPTVQGPQQRILKYDKILPNIGFVYDISSNLSAFGNYSMGLQVPGTDALYNAFFFAPNTATARPEPETSDNFDFGLRLRGRNIQAQLVGWITKYHDRLASAYDPVTDRNLYRNLGDVDKYGIDGSIAWQAMPELALYVFGSYMKSEIQENVQSGECASVNLAIGCAAIGDPIFIATAGRREGGAPPYSFGAQARTFLGPVEIGLTAKKNGGRYIYDSNLPIFAGTAAAPYQIYPAKTNGYWMVNLDARVNLEFLGLNDRTYLQLNIYNLFDKLYVGNFTSGLNQGGVIASGIFTGNPGAPPFAQIGAPRTVSATLSFGF